MADFENFDRKGSYFRPCQTHLDIYARLNKINLGAMMRGTWTYKTKIFCSIPIILFQCQCVGGNILIHLNMSLLKNLSTVSWLKSEQLQFMLMITDASRNGNVVIGKLIKLSKTDSVIIRNACQSQQTLSSTQVENLVDIIYQQEIDNIWQPNI